MHRISITTLHNWEKQKKRKPLILRGARQVGKSTLVRQFADAAGLRLVEINFEKNLNLRPVFDTLDATRIVEAIEADIKSKIDPDNSLLFFDEIHACPQAIVALRYFYEDLPQFKVIAAGSLLEFALTDKKLSMPVGRVSYHNLGPLSFGEFLLAKGENFLFDRIKAYEFGQEWPATLHQHLQTAVRTFLMVGGMPEAVQAFVDGASDAEVRRLQQNLVALYADDFSKYATKTELAKLQTLYARMPQFIGKKIKFSQILPNERSNTTANLLHLLEKAGIIHIIYHSDCVGIPLAAHADPQVGKVYWLDCGLLNQMQGLAWDDLRRNDALITEGILAEQFVAQELLNPDESPLRPQLHYWLREGKKGNAEVDFVIQKSTQIIPIEVKSGKIGKIKSLLYMLGLRNLSAAIRVSSALPAYVSHSHKVTIESLEIEVKYNLFECPPYLVGEIRRLNFPV